MNDRTSETVALLLSNSYEPAQALPALSNSDIDPVYFMVHFRVPKRYGCQRSSSGFDDKSGARVRLPGNLAAALELDQGRARSEPERCTGDGFTGGGAIFQMHRSNPVSVHFLNGG